MTSDNDDNDDALRAASTSAQSADSDSDPPVVALEAAAQQQQPPDESTEGRPREEIEESPQPPSKPSQPTPSIETERNEEGEPGSFAERQGQQQDEKSSSSELKKKIQEQTKFLESLVELLNAGDWDRLLDRIRREAPGILLPNDASSSSSSLRRLDSLGSLLGLAAVKGANLNCFGIPRSLGGAVTGTGTFIHQHQHHHPDRNEEANAKVPPLELFTTVLEVAGNEAVLYTGDRDDNTNDTDDESNSNNNDDDNDTPGQDDGEGADGVGTTGLMIQELGRTPFHLCMMYLDRPDICRTLLEASSSACLSSSSSSAVATTLGANIPLVSRRDAEGLRGIDILTQKILMKDEHLRYAGARFAAVNIELEQQSLLDCLECARLVTIHHAYHPRATNYNNNDGKEIRYDYDLPLFHACCMARSDIPLSLMERTLRREGQEAWLRDARGNTPLHYAASTGPPWYNYTNRHNHNHNNNNTQDDEDDEDDEDEEEDQAEERYIMIMDDILPRILRINPQAAALQNFEHDEYPLDLAIRCGRTWNTGCRVLLEAYPPAVLHRQAKTALEAKTLIYSLFTTNRDDNGTSNLLRRHRPPTSTTSTSLQKRTARMIVYSILRAQPEILGSS